MTRLEKLQQMFPNQIIAPNLLVWFITNLVNYYGEEEAIMWLGGEWQKGDLKEAFLWAHTPQGHQFWSDWCIMFDEEEVAK